MTTTQQLLYRITTSQDIQEIAGIMADIANRAERVPWLQQYLRRIALPPPFHVYEYIKPGNRKGYWARRPAWREHPTPRQLEARLKFGKINFMLYGTKGTVQRQDGTRISKISRDAGDLMKGELASAKELEERRRQRVIERVTKSFTV